METLERAGADEGTPNPVTPDAGKAAGLRAPRTNGEYAKLAAGFVGVLGLIYWAFVEEKVRGTIVTVIIAVGASAGLWIGANLLFNQVRGRWQFFSTVAFAIIGAVVGIVLHGNLVTIGSGDGFLTWVVGPLAGAAAFGALGFALARTDDPRQRQLIALGGATAIGLVIGAVIRDAYQPGLDPVAILAYTLVGVAVGAGLSLLRKHPPLHGALIGGAIGWIFGAWGGADLGDGSPVTSIVAAVVPAVLIGLRLGMSKNPDYRARVALDDRSRAIIFLGPALLFISVMLVIPAIRTMYLSLLDPDSVDFVGIENYTDVFTDPNSLDLDNWTNMFTSIPFIIGMILLAIALGRRHRDEASAPAEPSRSATRRAHRSSPVHCSSASAPSPPCAAH